MPDEKQSELELAQPVEADMLPPVVLPQTKTPFTFNQQVNIQRIPNQAWDRLSPDQIVDLVLGTFLATILAIVLGNRLLR